jgi:NTE family protein
VVAPNQESLAAFTADALDPAVRAPSAEAGRRQGAESASRLEDLWTV